MIIIQIPCRNEADTLAVALRKRPRSIQGFDSVKWLLVDTGSRNDTMHIAKGNPATANQQLLENVRYNVRYKQRKARSAGRGTEDTYR